MILLEVWRCLRVLSPPQLSTIVQDSLVDMIPKYNSTKEFKHTVDKMQEDVSSV